LKSTLVGLVLRDELLSEFKFRILTCTNKIIRFLKPKTGFSPIIDEMIGKQLAGI
jgi:hypothetical protein